MRINAKWKIAAASITLGLLLVLAFFGVALAFQPENVFPGVSVMGCDLSGMTRDQAGERLVQLERETVLSAPLVFRQGGRAWPVQPAAIGLAVDRERVLDEALGVGRRGPFWRRWEEWRRAGTEGFGIPLYVRVDQASLESRLNAIAGEIAVPPRDARLKINPDETVEVVPSRDGVAVDVTAACLEIGEVFKNPGPAREVSLRLARSSPARSTRDLLDMGVNFLLASYSTEFDAGDSGRSYNIGVAAGALDGIFVAPGEEFSFNGVVGPRSSEAGYMNAKIIVNNQFIDGLGGGVCQVSSTLYNAVLLANLEILERTCHSLQVFYVPPGRDATVTFDLVDFRFRNSTPLHIYLKTLVSPGRITVKIYGNAGFRREVAFRTRVLESIPFKEIYEQDPSLKEGDTRIKQNGIAGMRVAAERLVLVNGTWKSENLPDSFYRPLDQIVLVGAAPGKAGGGVVPGQPGGGAVSGPPGGGVVPGQPGGGVVPGQPGGGAVSGPPGGGVVPGPPQGAPANPAASPDGPAKKENPP